MTTNATARTLDLLAAQPRTRSFLRHVPTGARLFTGALFFVFGLNGFLNFLPPPSEPGPERAMAFAMALLHTGYMFPLIKGTEVAAGCLLLCNRFVPLALVTLAPVIVNIVAFHAFLAPAELPMAILVLALEVYLAWAYRAAFASLLTKNATFASR
jgi:hypothetical protein